ncbi:hypothetical protein UXP85_25660 [Enterobacter cloacae]|uniref:hypothetical protein n=1 Tax=Enterobacter cloacae TaxID=550 RepID=UPI001FF2512D|nr:hypothetical protein [Enterobacter cloacae]MCJ8539097.1 hypothetical protein [Enterobacter cloacae]HDC4545106.1 hypothetical protein [Enterobacter cloacae]HDC4579677.1 hypothetical protein [Enterobacter cloacae]
MALAPRFHTVIAGPARKNDPQVIEAICKVAILPGSLVELDASGQSIYHATAGGPGVALAMQHNYIGGGDIRDAVPAGDTGAAIMCEDDVDYHMRVKAGEVLLENEGLVSAGDGTLAKSTTPATDQVLFYSREKITVGAEAQLVKVRKSGKATA